MQFRPSSSMLMPLIIAKIITLQLIDQDFRNKYQINKSLKFIIALIYRDELSHFTAFEKMNLT